MTSHGSKFEDGEVKGSIHSTAGSTAPRVRLNRWRRRLVEKNRESGAVSEKIAYASRLSL